jgi:spermidine synthase
VAARPKFEVLACEESKLGLLILRRRELLSQPGVTVTEVTLNHEFLMSSYLTVSERTLASSALEIHGGQNLAVLVGGLGLGYTAHEALASSSVSRVDVIEYLPEVIGWLRDEKIPLAASLGSEPRLKVVEGDVYAALAAPVSGTYDLVLIDVDHSPEEPLGSTSSAFYTEAGLRTAKQHLSPRGVLGVWSYAAHSPFRDALQAVFREVHAQPVKAWNDLVDEEQTDWLFFAHD